MDTVSDSQSFVPRLLNVLGFIDQTHLQLVPVDLVFIYTFCLLPSNSS